MNIKKFKKKTSKTKINKIIKKALKQTLIK